MNPYATFIHWLHLISAIFWIGGNAYQVFVLIPFMKAGDPSDDLLQKMSKRFTRMSSIFLVILVVTGGMNFGFRRMGVDWVPPGYISALAVKVFLIVAMAAFLLFGLIRPTKTEKPPKAPAVLYAKVSLVFGVLIVFLAAMLRQWRF